MNIAQSEVFFREFLAQHGKGPEQLLPEELLGLGFKFFESVRAVDALPVTNEDFGDALLLQWGAREALPPHYGACYYFDLTRQFIAQEGEDDDAMFQLTCQLQYELTPELRALATGNRWCSSLGDLAEFKAFALSHAAFAAVVGRRPAAVEFYLTPV
jgi:hypothetical protein